MFTVPPWLPMPELSLPTLPRPSSSFQWATRPRPTPADRGPRRSGAGRGWKVDRHIGVELHPGSIAAWLTGAAALTTGATAARRAARAALQGAARIGPGDPPGPVPPVPAAPSPPVPPCAPPPLPPRPLPPRPPANPSPDPSWRRTRGNAVGGRRRTASEHGRVPPGRPRRYYAAGCDFLGRRSIALRPASPGGSSRR